MGKIEQCIDDWHRYLRGELSGGLDALLADDVVFYSPIVFTPGAGKDTTKLYLRAAEATLGVESSKSDDEGSPRETTSKFRYSKQVLSGNHAILEFETEMEGKYVNGVDIITCNDDARIIEFKVMIRPLQAVNLLHARMKEMLARMQANQTSSA